MMIVQLHQAKPCDDVVGGLRALADEIEAGLEWPVTTCVVLLGHTGAESNPDNDGTCRQACHWRVHGYGPRTDTFTVRGLMMSASRDWEGD